MEEINSNYTKIPNDLLFSGNPHEVVLWGIIRHFETMDQGICNCSIKTLAKYLQLSRVQTQRILSDMVTKKLISVTQKKGFNSQYRTICNFSNTIAKNSNTGNICGGIINDPTEKNVSGEKKVATDKISGCIKNDTTVKNVTGDISSMIQGDVSSMIHHNKTVYNKTDNNNITINQSNKYIQAQSLFCFDIVNPEFEKPVKGDGWTSFNDQVTQQIKKGVYPWNPGTPDKIYYIAKQNGYSMTLSEIYKFSLILSIGHYYDFKKKDWIRVNNFDLLFRQWQKRQSKDIQETDQTAKLEDNGQYSFTDLVSGKTLATVTIPFCEDCSFEIERTAPITHDTTGISTEKINIISGKYYYESKRKDDSRKFADGKHLPGINDYVESDEV